MTASELFEILARSTWRTIARTYHNHIVFGEDAITSYNLDALSSPGVGVVVEDTRVTESTKGCDFELWVGSDTLGWSRYAVQAKKISVSSASYANLKHKVGTQYQIDILAAYAGANRAAPLYCFYNHSSGPYQWNCNLPPEIEQLGVSVTPLNVVRAAIATRGGRTFSWIHQRPETVPWRCLVRCPVFTHSIPSSVARPGWPPRDQYSHAKLPEPLRRLQETRDARTLADAPDLFSRAQDLRPGWVGIIDFERG